jgi:competence protein ComEC
MSAALLAFAAGVLLLQQQGALPAPALLAAAPLAALGAALSLAAAARGGGARSVWTAASLGCAAACGFLWAGLLAQQRIAERLAPALEGRDLALTGVVAGLPALGERGARFAFDVEQPSGLPRHVLLGWYRDAAAEGSPVHPGERWRFTVRLRRPHGSLNPYGFDYEGWLIERDIGATGYVRAGGRRGQRGEPLRLGARNSFADRIEQAREAVRARFERVLGARPATGILVALAVGDQHSISAEQWRLFNRTAVTHLMSISGLHVTLVSGLVAWLVALGWRRAAPLASRLAARKAAAAAAVAAALGYALLAGFAVPAQRTVLMVSVVAAALWSARVVPPARTLAIALAVVLAADPWAVLAPGFWLSFGAVALIFYVSAGGVGREARPLQWLRVQWAITVGLAPATLFLFAQVCLAGPLANAVAIPLVSVIVTPLTLAAAVVPVDALLHLAAWLTEWLLVFLHGCAALPNAVLAQHAAPLWATLLACAGAAWLLAPPGIPWRPTGVALMLPAFALPAPAPAAGEAWLETLDVGQGLAIVVRTAHHALLYDAGPAYGPDSDAGARVIGPFLRACGVARLDAVVLSHDDTDHVGGAASIFGAFQVGRLFSSLPASHPLLARAPEPRRCARGTAWEWDGVRFAFLHPAAGQRPEARANDLSCVLRVSAAGHAMLLTGDIERAAEATLLGSRAALGADVLLVPHHGSRTSSSADFLAAVRPAFAVVSAGYRNRFGHPNARVLERYRAGGIRLLRTDRDGAVEVRLAAGGAALQSERARRRRYWHASDP